MSKSAALASPLKRPSRPGFMGPMAVLTMVHQVTTLFGEDASNDLLKHAELFRLPAQDEPVREDKVARLHQSVRHLWPENAAQIARAAGEDMADFTMETRMPERAQELLKKAPMPVGAWLLGQSLLQNAWTFSGSGTFRILNRLEFGLSDNPLVQGETGTAPLCAFHAGLIERMFKALIDPGFVCTETGCSGHGHTECTFRLTTSPVSI